jgi:biopolymer transport protein ExbB
MLNEKIFAIANIADQTVLYVLIFLSIVSVGMILERFFSLRKVSNESRQIRARVRLALQTHSLDEVESLSKNPEALEGRALAVAMKHIKVNGSLGLEELFSSFTSAERPELEKYLSFLATIGSNAPYIGLFGTVLGIMKAFRDLAISSDAGQQTVMAGISSALIATATGLFVAIPAVIFYNYFQRQVRGILQNLDSVKQLCLSYAKSDVKKQEK